MNHKLNAGTLRISIDQTPAILTIRLEGRVAGEMVTELGRAWFGIAHEIGTRDLIVDLCDAVFVDPSGVALLSEIHKTTHTTFRTNSPLTRYFAEQAMAQEPNGASSKKGA